MLAAPGRGQGVRGLRRYCSGHVASGGEALLAYAHSGRVRSSGRGRTGTTHGEYHLPLEGRSFYVALNSTARCTSRVTYRNTVFRLLGRDGACCDALMMPSPFACLSRDPVGKREVAFHVAVRTTRSPFGLWLYVAKIKTTFSYLYSQHGRMYCA